MSLCKPIWLKREGKKKEREGKEKKYGSLFTVLLIWADFGERKLKESELFRLLSSFLLIPPRFHHFLLEKTRFVRNLYTLIPSHPSLFLFLSLSLWSHFHSPSSHLSPVESVSNMWCLNMKSKWKNVFLLSLSVTDYTLMNWSLSLSLLLSS